MQKKIPTHYLTHLSDRYLVEVPGSGLSWRSMLLGLGLVVAISIGSPYSIWMVGSSEMTWSYFPIAVGAPLFLLVLGNALLKRALSAAELITIIIMGLGRQRYAHLHGRPDSQHHLQALLRRTPDQPVD